MMDLDGFNQLVDEIMAQGYDEETAARYASLIGDTPQQDADGNVLVRADGGTQTPLIAKLKPLAFFASEE